MPKLFGVNIAKIINNELGKKLEKLTITKFHSPYETPEVITGVNGFIESFSDFQRSTTIGVEDEDRIIGVFGDSAGYYECATDDTILHLPSGKTYTVVRTLSRDPASALYTYHCRG